ncbi:MAG TPA: hypothetical protein VNJ08_13845 [Bacteriovoracaceae bacterium]|nr:hypothetical protein [Bacteriovoracaceae bacterium]
MKFIFLGVIALLVGCAAHKNYNQTTTGRVVYTGGIYQKEVWDDYMQMQRMSWYHGMTLYYDVIFWKADASSPFSKWFSAAEKEYFTKCESFIVTAGYSADPTKISHVNFREQMKLNGYDDVVINSFGSYIKSHPSSIEWRFQNYKVIGFCKRSPTRLGTSNLAINFSGFKQLEVDL